MKEELGQKGSILIKANDIDIIVISVSGLAYEKASYCK